VWTWRWAEGVLGCVGERDGGEGGGQQDDGGKIMATRTAAQPERTTEPDDSDKVLPTLYCLLRPFR